jgi:hypothetical protein
MNPRLAVWELERASALRFFQRQYGPFLSRGAEAQDESRRLLVVNLNNGSFKAHLHSLLAKALQLRGYTPTILTYRWCRDARRCHEVYGFSRFEFLDEYLGRLPREARASIEQAAAALTDSVSVRQIKAMEYRGINVGRPTLSSISRNLLRGRVALSDETIRGLLRRWLPLAMERVWAAEMLLDRVQPESVLFHEKGYLAEGPLFEAALRRGLNVVYWCHAHRDDALMFKRYTWDTRYLQATSLSEETWAAVREQPWSARHDAELMEEFQHRYEDSEWFLSRRYQEGKQLKSRSEVQHELGLDPAKPTAVVFSHMTWDASFFHGDDLFDDYEEWLIETIRAACENPRVNWVIKLHPGNVYKFKAEGYQGECSERAAIRETIGVLPPHIKLLDADTDINTFSLFDVTDYCVTVRGTIGIEMACYGIPVFTAGTGRYAGLGFTVDSQTPQGYLATVRRIHEFPRLTPQATELARKYAYTLFKQRPARFTTFQTVFRHHRPIRHPLFWDLNLSARSFADLVEAEDLNAFADWVVTSRSQDFLVSEGGAAGPIRHLAGAATAA